jgi:hypothetical protein
MHTLVWVFSKDVSSPNRLYWYGQDMLKFWALVNEIHAKYDDVDLERSLGFQISA